MAKISVTSSRSFLQILIIPAERLHALHAVSCFMKLNFPLPLHLLLRLFLLLLLRLPIRVFGATSSFNFQKF
jgi:hypothetical protein